MVKTCDLPCNSVFRYIGCIGNVDRQKEEFKQ